MNTDFFIDGKKVSAAPGETILEVAARNGIAIPALCCDKNVSCTTSCFVCVVKDVKSGRFLPSCASIPAPGQEIESDSAEVSDMRQTALNLLLSEHSGDCEAPCTVACPAHASVEEYVRAGRNGEWQKALEIIKKRIPLPMSIGRVCPRFCEKNCRRNIDGKPVAINEFKRLAADLCYDSYMEEIPESTGKKVAVIGGGPAGLSAAYYLRLAGVEVTVFEAMPLAGGMTRYGIPEYRLPKKAVLDRELALFDKMGVKFVFNTTVGKDLSVEQLRQDFDAVVVAVGCWQGAGIRCRGEELALSGIGFLRAIAENNNTLADPGKVIVVGGGNTAMDCVRSAVRLGSRDVSCFYRRTEAEMPAEKLEIEEAKEEGVKFQFLVAPVSLEKRGDKLVLTCRRMELGEPDASGRRRPVEIPGSEFECEADTVIGATGQKTILPENVPSDRFGNVAPAENNCCKAADGLYGAGDALHGAATVVEAVASGRRAALEIQRDILGMAIEEDNPILVSRGKWQYLDKKDLVISREVSPAARAVLPVIPLKKRISTFEEITHTIDAEVLQQEGERCIECSCSDKHDCKLRRFAAEYRCDPEKIRGRKLPVSYDNRHPEIIQDRGKCIKCAVCVKTCAEVVNRNILGIHKRGFNTFIGTAFDGGMPANCSDCGACVEACPTGALSWRHKKND